MTLLKPFHPGPKPDPNDLSRCLSEKAAHMSYDELEAKDVEAAKRSILDTLGVSLVATAKAPKTAI